MMDAEVLSFLGSDDLAGIWQVARQRLERNGIQVAGQVSIDLDEDQARALRGLLGRHVGTGACRLKLPELDQALRRSRAGVGLVAVVEAVHRQDVRDRTAEAAANRSQRAELDAGLDRALHTAGLGQAPWVAEFTNQVRRSGALTRAGSGADLVLVQLAATLTCLEDVLSSGIPRVDQAVGLGELATEVAGTAHGLDPGSSLAALVLRAGALALGVAVPVNGHTRRQLWAWLGVSVDQVSATVACWALRPPGSDAWSTMMRARADLDLVTHLTVGELTGAFGGTTPPALTRPGVVVFACENPQVLQAAAGAGTKSPVVCFFGNPTSAGWLVLNRLVAGGAQVAYHGDFDWQGVAIAARALARGAVPWRMSADDYRFHASRQEWQPLSGSPTATPWDPELATEMAARKVAVHEEGMLETLLADLE